MTGMGDQMSICSAFSSLFVTVPIHLSMRVCMTYIDVAVLWLEGCPNSSSQVVILQGGLIIIADSQGVASTDLYSSTFLLSERRA